VARQEEHEITWHYGKIFLKDVSERITTGDVGQSGLHFEIGDAELVEEGL
jgi:hypothetical protein